MSYAPLSHIVQPSHNKRLALEALLASDEALEARCHEAWGLVTSCETLRQNQQVAAGGGVHGSGSSNSAGPGPELATKEQRQLVLDFGLELVQRVGWKSDVCYDAFDLLQRVLPLVRATAQQDSGAAGDAGACNRRGDGSLRFGASSSAGMDSRSWGMETAEGSVGSNGDAGGSGSSSSSNIGAGVEPLSSVVMQQLMLGCIMVAARQGEMVGRLLPFEMLSRQTGEWMGC
jgi:hypothetical protein